MGAGSCSAPLYTVWNREGGGALSNVKFELTKSIEARKLNPRTGAPSSDPPVTIPFGALIDRLTSDRDMDRFYYLLQPYQCPHAILATAIVEVAAFGPLTPPAAVPPTAVGETAADPVPAAGPRLAWELLESDGLRCQRAKVPGGWLVLVGGGALAFYPDAAHSWDGGSQA